MTNRHALLTTGLLLTAVVLGAIATAPSVSAHSCQGDDCGPCLPDEYHEHKRPGSACIYPCPAIYTPEGLSCVLFG